MSTARRIGAIRSAAVLLALTACTAGQQPSLSPDAPITMPSSTTSATASLPPDVGGRPPQSTLRAVDPDPLAQITEPAVASWSGTSFVIALHPATTAQAGNVTISFSRVRPSAPSAGHGPDAAPGNPNRPYPPVEFWTSSDGQGWSTSGESGTGEPRAFAFDQTGAGVAVGYGEHGGAVWTSPDGRTWTRLPDPRVLLPATGETELWLDTVTHGPAGYVAVGTVSHPEQLTPQGFTYPSWSVVFWSADGHVWHREATGAFGHAFLRDIVSVNGRYVISGLPSSSTPLTLWTSTDGRSWSKEPAPDGVTGTTGTLVATASEALLVMDATGGCLAWRSLDGVAWTQVTTGCPHPVDGLVAGPSDFVAYTSTPSHCALTYTRPNFYFCAALIEVSTMGEQWASLRSPTSSGEVIAASANEILWSGNGEGSDGVGLWIADVGNGRLGP